MSSRCSSTICRSDADNRASLGTLARTLLDEISRTFYVNQQEVYLTASVGIAICPYDAENVIDLIRNADAAMYHSKQNGGNTCAFYVPQMNAAAVERLMLKSKLRRALERDELVILYQSKVDLRDGRVVGRRGPAALAAARARRYFTLAFHSARGRNQFDIGHRRVGAESRLRGLPRMAEAPFRSRAESRSICRCVN